MARHFGLPDYGQPEPPRLRGWRVVLVALAMFFTAWAAFLAPFYIILWLMGFIK